MVARKIPKNYRNLTGVIFSVKNGAQVAFESTLERDLYLMWDFSPLVKSYIEQPVSIQFQFDGKQLRTYTPDALVHFHDRKSELVEVKYESDLAENWNELKPRFKAAIRHAKQNGWRFRIYTERRIRSEYLNNITFLRKYLRLSPKPVEQKHFINTLFELRESSPAELIATLNVNRWNQASCMPTLWYLIANHEIETDLTKPLNMHSRIWLPQKGVNS